MWRRSVLVGGLIIGSILSVTATISVPSWQREDPSQWTSEDVYQILNNSAWSKAVSVTVAKHSGYGGQSPGSGGNGGPWGEGTPGGGMGRGPGGMGGGMGRGRGGSPPSEQEQTVTVQWASALPVRLAEAKSSGSGSDRGVTRQPNEYVIAVIGLPKSGFESHGSSGSDSDGDDMKFADHLKIITVLSVAHERLNPTQIEFNRGRDGRTVFHFEKSEPITLRDKDAEFRISGDRMEVRKKFGLKDMVYLGSLEL